MTKAELTAIAKDRYFKGNKNVDLMYATSDGHFFHANAKNAAQNSLSNRSAEVYEITRADSEGKVEVVEVVEQVIEVKEETAYKAVSSESSESFSDNSKPKTKPKKGKSGN